MTTAITWASAIISNARWLVAALLLGAGAAHAAQVYQAPADFVREAFDGQPPPARPLDVTPAMAAQARTILGHDLGVLRLRYWRRDGRSAWVLEEIGKERPITVGVVVAGGRLARIDVLIYRESRGMEVASPAFTDQFIGASLSADQRLDRHIDAISGATLSVRALTELARLALYLTSLTEADHDSP